MPLFIGEYQGAVASKGRLTLPSKLRDNIPRDITGAMPVVLDVVDGGLGKPALSVEPCIVIRPLVGSAMHSWANSHVLSSSLRSLARAGELTAAAPAFHRSSPAAAVGEARARLVELLTTTTAGRRRSGRDFEDALAEVFRDVGVSVQQRVRLVGAEVDLLLCEVVGGGETYYAIVECKDYSRGSVGIAEVMRLFGLREVLRRSGVPTEAMLATTANLSQNGRRLARSVDISVANADALLEWLEHLPHTGAAQAHLWPYFEVSTVAADGRLRVSSELRGLVGLTIDDVRVVGVGSCMEIWSASDWDSIVAESDAFMRNIENWLLSDGE